MLPPSHHSTTSGLSFEVIELGLTLIGVASAFCWPRANSRWFSALESFLDRLARRQRLSVFVIGFVALAARLSILPLSPIPNPFIHDDFSFLLAGDTFASGRLTNPTPPMWMHFESFHITMKPTYMSMYFPAQGMVLAAGKLIAGNAWFGVLMSAALMCAAICWMLQAWLPAGMGAPRRNSGHHAFIAVQLLGRHVLRRRRHCRNRGSPRPRRLTALPAKNEDSRWNVDGLRSGYSRQQPPL